MNGDDVTPFECLVCMPNEDDSNVTHYPMQRYKTTYSSGMRRHPHEAPTHIIEEGLLESHWWMLHVSIRRAIVKRHAGANSWLADLVEQDGASRNAGKRYLMTTDGRS